MSDGGILLFPSDNPSTYVGLSIRQIANFNANVPATSILGLKPRKPTRVFRLDVHLLIFTLATSAANTQFLVTSTDQVGAFTVPVPLIGGASGAPAASINIGAGGVQRACGSYILQALQTINAAAVDVSISIAGITTPGPLSGRWAVALTPIG